MNLNTPRLLWLLALLCPFAACGQGTLYFQNRGGSYNGQLDEPVLSYDSTPVAGDRFSAQLWVGRSVDSLSSVIESRTIFRSGAAAGYVVSLVNVMVPGISPGETAWVQVRAWENGPAVIGWEDAWLRGESNVFPLVLGGGSRRRRSCLPATNHPWHEELHAFSYPRAVDPRSGIHGGGRVAVAACQLAFVATFVEDIVSSAAYPTYLHPRQHRDYPSQEVLARPTLCLTERLLLLGHLHAPQETLYPGDIQACRTFESGANCVVERPQ
jgi:hypothetical protein